MPEPASFIRSSSRDPGLCWDDRTREVARLGQKRAGEAASTHKRAGRPVYYEDPAFAGRIVKELPDGRRFLVELDEEYREISLRQISSRPAPEGC